MRKIKNNLFIVLFLTPLFSQSQAKQKGIIVNSVQKDTGRIFALILGISRYSELTNLQYADKDAEYFYNYLNKLKNIDDSSRITLLTNENATRDAVTDKLYSITENVRPGDKVYFYFSGHGDVEQLIYTDNCLLLLSHSPTKNYLRKSNSYLDINLFRTFYQSWAQKNVKTIFICDACHSGSLIGGEEGRKNTILSLQQSWGNEIKLFSCQAGEISLEGKQWGGGRGLFSFYFLLGLKGLADKDKNNEINLFELDSYLKTNVSSSSNQYQIPIAHGDLKSIVGKVSVKSLADAKKEILNVTANNSDLFVMKGVNNSVIDLIKDSLLNVWYISFKEKIKSNQLLEPDSFSAYYYYKLLESSHLNCLVVEKIRIELLEALQKSFDHLLDYIYIDQYEKFGIYEKIELEKQLSKSLELAGRNLILANKIMSKLLFVQACELSDGIDINTNTYFSNEKLSEGIELLKKAIKIDSLSPNLFLRLGDYLLYTNKLSEAVDAYLNYQQLLPNDEYSYNKLGMAYVALKQIDKAITAFKLAIEINPRFYKAVENLKIAENKKW